jgi:hypothetical protein
MLLSVVVAALWGLSAGQARAQGSSPVATPEIEMPGPSASLFAAPFYVCRRTFYVAPAGRDINPGTRSAPWATLRHADIAAGGRIAGDCVDVAPGTYPAGVTITRGGNLASPSGYVVYRCEVLDKCKITAPGGNAEPTFTIIAAGAGPDYLVIDGFDLAAGSETAYGVGVLVTNNPIGGPKPRSSAHHIWVTNNVIHGYGEGGVGTNEADWIYVLHNAVYGNAHVTCDAQGSGIGLVVAKAVRGYEPTTADRAWAPFHQVVAWNVVHDNMLTKCGNAQSPYDTDGNGIILDTFNGAGEDNLLYESPTLVANNVTYANGGAGILVFRSSYMTVANNTSYNNNLDPWNRGYPRGEISNVGGTFNTYLNNIAQAIPATGVTDVRCQGANYDVAPNPCPLMGNVAFFGGNGPGVTDVNNAWSHNISFGGSPPWGWGPRGNAILQHDSMSCTSNQCNIDPLLANPEHGNFALRAASPAIDYGKSENYLSPQARDAGACYHAATDCP